MARQDHFYPNLPKTLGEAIDTCVSTIFKGNTRKYQDRKDFIVKSIQNQIELETKRNPILGKKLQDLLSVAIMQVENSTSSSNNSKSRGNRIHDIIRSK